MNHTIERRWIGYDWFKLIVALILAALLLLFRSAASPGTTALTSAINPPAVATAAPSVQIAAPVLTAPVPGAQAAPGPITFSGMAAPGVQVQVLVDGTPAGTARAGADGTWMLNATVDKPGMHQVVVQALDDKDAVAASASPATLAIAAPLPQIAAPTLDLPGQPLVAGDSPLSGAGTPGATIEIVVDGMSAGTTTAGADGKWSLPVTLLAGDHNIVARALDATGQTAAAASPARVSVSGAAQAPTAAPGSGTPAQAPAITQPAAGATVDGGSFTLAGTGTPGSQIEILDGDTVIGTATIGADGAWRFPTTATAGQHQYAVQPAGGATTASSLVSITVSAPPASAGAQLPVITAPADGARLDGGPITITGTGTPGSQIEILDSDKAVGTAVIGADGTWSFQATPGGATAAYSARPAGSADVTGKPIRVTIGTAPVGACTDLAVNCNAWVTRTGGLVLRMRAGAGTSQSIVARLPVGTQLQLLEGHRRQISITGGGCAPSAGARDGWLARNCGRNQTRPYRLPNRSADCPQRDRAGVAPAGGSAGPQQFVASGSTIIVGTMDSRRAQQVLETLLEGIAGSGASIAILDITGVALVDTQVANALIRAAQAVQLLGAQVVLTGIRPEVAQTLVGLGVDLGGIVTRGTLQSGIAFALEQPTTNTRSTR